MKNSSLYFGDTVLIFDPEWAGRDGHDRRTAVVIADNGSTVTVVRTSTARARVGRPAPAGCRRLAADGVGVGNSLAKPCDLMAITDGIVTLDASAIVPGYRGRLDRGHLSDTDMDWLDGRLDAMGWG